MTGELSLVAQLFVHRNGRVQRLHHHTLVPGMWNSKGIITEVSYFGERLFTMRHIFDFDNIFHGCVSRNRFITFQPPCDIQEPFVFQCRQCCCSLSSSRGGSDKPASGGTTLSTQVLVSKSQGRPATVFGDLNHVIALMHFKLTSSIL